LNDLVQDLVQLDKAAIEAYSAAIERIENVEYKQQLTSFREDHVEHTRALGTWLRAHQEDAPQSGGLKETLTTGKVALAGLMGDKQILMAMKTNEDDTNTAYERAVNHREAGGIRATFEKNLGDERRHRSWMESVLATL
jgi:rubrerythrin